MSIKSEVIVRYRSDQDSSSDRNPAERFWSGIRERDQGENRSIRDLEAKLEKSFPEHLKRRLIDQVRRQFIDEPWHRHFVGEFYPEIGREFAKEISRNRAERVDRIEGLVSKISFRVKTTGYSSLKLMVEAAPSDAICELLGGIDALELFLEAAMPYCFDQTYDNDVAEMFTFDVTTQEEKKPQIKHSEEPPVDGSNSKRNEKLEKIWKIANFSLVLPVLLLVYIFLQGLHQLAEIRSNDTQLLELQMKMLQTDADRISMLFSRCPCAASPENRTVSSDKAQAIGSGKK